MSEIILMDALKDYIVGFADKYFPTTSITKEIFFEKPNANSWEGQYVYLENDMYHLSYSEKGKSSSSFSTRSIEELIFQLFKSFVFEDSLDYAKKNWIKGQDFRRQLFKRELEISKSISDYFYRSMNQEIDSILEENPYIDK